MEWILKSWLTNRSLYSLGLLILLATIVNEFMVEIFSYFSLNNSGLLFLESGHFWLILVYQIVWSEIFALVMFSAANAVTRRWQPFFLEKK